MSRRKPKSRRYHEAYVRLNAAFPLAFPLDDADLRPLALSTREDLRAWIDTQHIERAQASALLSVMQQQCCRLTYQQVVAAGGMRITLHGEPVEPVTPEGQAHAQGRMTAILAARAVAAERLAAQPQPPQASPTPTPSPPKSKSPPQPKAPPVLPAPARPSKAPALPTAIIKKRRRVVRPDERKDPV